MPKKRTDLVASVYESDAPSRGMAVVVKVPDMLGAEMLKTLKV